MNVECFLDIAGYEWCLVPEVSNWVLDSRDKRYERVKALLMCIRN